MVQVKLTEEYQNKFYYGVEVILTASLPWPLIGVENHEVPGLLGEEMM